MKFQNKIKISFIIIMCEPGPTWPTPPTGKFDVLHTRLLKVDTVFGDCIEATVVTGLDPPSSGSNATNKDYVDAKTFKDSVRVSTAAAGDLSTDFSTGQVVDNVTLVTGDRILIKNQTNGSENGIYTVNATGSPTRSDDAKTTMEASGSAVVVQEGSTNEDTFWICDTSPSVTFGNSISFIQIVGGGSGAPSAPFNSVQFNNAGAFGGSANLLWNGSSLLVEGTVQSDTLELDDGSGNVISITAPSISSDYGIVLPINDGDSNQVLTTDGSGNTSWQTCSSIYTRTVVNTSTYTILDTDDIIAVRYTPTGTVTLTLPNITTSKQYSIVDEGGLASVNNIIINADASDTIIGQASFTINNDYNSVTIYNDASSEWFIR